MGTHRVIEGKIALEPLVGVARRRVIMEIDLLLIFHGAPKPFGKDVVERPALTIHADLHLLG